MTKRTKKTITKKEDLLLCPLAYKCLTPLCTHKIPHKRQLGPMNQSYCKSAFVVCPACEEIIIERK